MVLILLSEKDDDRNSHSRDDSLTQFYESVKIPLTTYNSAWLFVVSIKSI